MNTIKTWRVPLAIILCVAVGVTARTYPGSSNNSPSESGIKRDTQDVTNLDRRISLLEQRFYAIESSINRLEQQAALYGREARPSSSLRDPEIGLLRGEVETLQRRLVEVECGLARLDERTLTPAAREARKRAGTSVTDPCRLSADAPLRLSTRP
jgi:predicted RNase H-like nuclease (RuvC/YqgF family)